MIKVHKNIYIEQTDQDLTALGGVTGFDYLYNMLEIAKRVAPHLPTQKVAGIKNSLQKFKDLALGFVEGCDCLDDMAHMAEDEAIKNTLPDFYTPKAYGDFLRDFSTVNLKGLNLSVAKLAWTLRCFFMQNFCEKDPKRHFDTITFDFDSTLNRQYGLKMEGVRPGYKEYLCLDTLQVFCDKGFQYWNEVREGGTHTAEGSSEIVHHVMDQVPKEVDGRPLRRLIRADAGYCNYNFMNSCHAKDCGFVVRLIPQILDTVVGQVTHWQRQNPNDEDRICFYDKRECDVGSTVFYPDRSHYAMRVVVIRAPKKDHANSLFKSIHTDYDYFAWITNIGEGEMGDVELIRFYRGRGHAENFIREVKYGFDLKHYPCLKLDANRAYGLIAAFAYNLMRLTALQLNPKKPGFAKKTRKRLLRSPAVIVRHAGRTVFRMMKRHIEEMTAWLERLKTLQIWYANMSLSLQCGRSLTSSS